jgi:hypothetical protein
MNHHKPSLYIYITLGTTSLVTSCSHQLQGQPSAPPKDPQLRCVRRGRAGPFGPGDGWRWMDIHG